MKGSEGKWKWEKVGESIINFDGWLESLEAFSCESQSFFHCQDSQGLGTLNKII